MESPRPLTRDEIEAHIKRLDMRIEGLKNGIIDRAMRLDSDSNDSAAEELQIELTHAREQKQLLENALHQLDSGRRKNISES
jgi:predicted  nucleic acid-binding Zn-ribbon protein